MTTVEQAALNNAVWCDTVCRSHGCPGKFLDEIWLNWQQTPTYYPNAITLNEARRTSSLLESIRGVMNEALPSGWGVKDSFAALELGALGFQTLLEARWIYKPATNPPLELRNSELYWEVVSTPAALNEWERVWSGGSGVGSIFLPELLRDPNIAVIGARQEGTIIAGFIANRAAECVGLSNVFLPVERTQELCDDCVAMAQLTFPGLPLVGYESGDDLEGMLASGFEAIGDLRVWLYQSEVD